MKIHFYLELYHYVQRLCIHYNLEYLSTNFLIYFPELFMLEYMFTAKKNVKCQTTKQNNEQIYK